MLEAELPRVERVDLEARYAAGTAGVSNLIKDMASHGDIAACAKTESVSTVARAIVVKVGPGKVSAHTAMMAATSLVNMYGKGDGSGPPS